MMLSMIQIKRTLATQTSRHRMTKLI